MKTTTFTTFQTVSDLIVATRGLKLYIQLSNNYFIPVSKKDLQKLVKAMKLEGSSFIAEVHSHSIDGACKVILY